MTAPRFLSMAEFAETFGISKRTVSDLVARGELPVVTFGRRRVIPAVVVEQLEAAALAEFDATSIVGALGAAS